MSGSTWGASWGACWGDTWGAVDVAAPGGGARRFTVPRDLVDAQRSKLIEADDILLLIAGCVAAGIIH